jgi:hypothetical protein
MTDYFANMPVMVLEQEGVNYTYPFIIVELIGTENYKIRFMNNDSNSVQEKYYSLKETIKNPLVVFNGQLDDITENRNNVLKAFKDFANGCIKHVNFN